MHQDEELFSPGLKTKNSSARDDSETERLQEALPPPNPLLPKSIIIPDRPPESSIKGIVFRQLKNFKHFSSQQVDQLGEQRNSRPTSNLRQDRANKQDSFSPLKDKSGNPHASGGFGSIGGEAAAYSGQAPTPLQIQIQQNRFVSNVVYLRDVSILESLGKEIEELTQKDVF